MSIASSIPSIKIKISPSPFDHHHHSSKLSFKPKTTITIIRSTSQADGPLRRPSTPSLSPPSLSPTPPLKPSTTQTPTPPKPMAAAATPTKVFVVTLEYQRKVAKELQEFFKLKKLEEADQAPFFGFVEGVGGDEHQLFVLGGVCGADEILSFDDVNAKVGEFGGEVDLGAW